MKNTQILKFEKEVNISTGSTFAKIEIEHGKNHKGEDYRNVNQINTSNENIYQAGNKFEDFEISLEEMIQVLNSEGYSI